MFKFKTYYSRILLISGFVFILFHFLYSSPNPSGLHLRLTLGFLNLALFIFRKRISFTGMRLILITELIAALPYLHFTLWNNGYDKIMIWFSLCIIFFGSFVFYRPRHVAIFLTYAMISHIPFLLFSGVAVQHLLLFLVLGTGMTMMICVIHDSFIWSIATLNQRVDDITKGLYFQSHEISGSIARLEGLMDLNRKGELLQEEMVSNELSELRRKIKTMERMLDKEV